MLEQLVRFLSSLYTSEYPPHPFDPLSLEEIEYAVAITRRKLEAEYPGTRLRFNTVALHEPPKADFLTWLETPTKRPQRKTEVIVVSNLGGVFDGVVNLVEGKVEKWEKLVGMQPMITMEDLMATEHYVRKDPKVIEQCKILGIKEEDMDKVYCDPWTIGHDERFGNKVRFQQAILFYRADIDDCQYAHPLDFCPIVNTETQEVIHIDIPAVRRPLNLIPSNYTPDSIKGGYRTGLKPINITQPQGASFALNGHVLDWQNWNLHVGFNHREGLVISNVTYFDRNAGENGQRRPIFYRMSLAEMVVPYGNPEFPHHRKHAFDLGEYGGGNMTNSLSLGCDCKGEIAYLPFHYVTSSGAAATIANAVCIHEEDTGILFKHTDFRDNSVIVTRGRKLVVSHIITAANYEYCVYWSFHLDGTIQLEIKLTGILNTYAMDPSEDTKGWGTQVHPGVNAHNHQHLFCLRLNPSLDGYDCNTVVQVDAVPTDKPVGSEANKYGNGFYAQKKRYMTVGEAQADYDGTKSRTWDMVNLGKKHPVSGNPVGYKLVSRECPVLLPQEGGLVWKRAGFARKCVFVTKYRDHQFYPAGRHVPQTTGEPSRGLPEWISETFTDSIENADIVLWHNFGVVHFPSPEDFPIMPVEGISLLLRPRNFFLRNPALDVRPSYSRTPKEVKEGKDGKMWEEDGEASKLAIGGGCCGKQNGNQGNGNGSLD
ncbi:peroxisomal copper amine oxidase [Kalaharituber pfeilii]|nr:peroxisomal copper amine oxidase [Kalaharituber pfeilii]